MVLVPAGKFIMGSKTGNPDEKPQRTVYLDAFYIDSYEVTNAEYQAFAKATNHPEPMGTGFVDNKFMSGFRPWQDSRFNRSNQPVSCVGWDDAVAYAKWAGKRLPTEAEWEKAARGTDGRTFPWSDFWEPNYCNSVIINGKTRSKSLYEFYNAVFIGDQLPAVVARKTTLPGGSFAFGKSPYGCYDMAGNVAEWVADYYSPNYYATAPNQNPKGPNEGQMRVIRGGGFNVGEKGVMCSARQHDDPRYWTITLGFRCAMDAPQAAPAPKPSPTKAKAQPPKAAAPKTPPAVKEKKAPAPAAKPAPAPSSTQKK
jgi:formylglycine-generating enzyme required for sulfatase activity